MSDNPDDPLLADIRGYYIDGRRVHNPFASDVVLVDRFDRWLAEHDRKVKAEALRAAANAWTQGEWALTPRHADRFADRMGASQFAGDWLRARADKIEAGEA